MMLYKPSVLQFKVEAFQTTLKQIQGAHELQMFFLHLISHYTGVLETKVRWLSMYLKWTVLMTLNSIEVLSVSLGHC